MAQGNRGNIDRPIALVATIVLQIALGFAVLHLRPQAPTPATHDDAIRVEFLRRSARVAPASRAQAARSPDTIAAAATAMSPARKPAIAIGSDERGTSTSESHPLDLHIEDPASPPHFETHDAFARRPVLDARTTRFERAWMPAGTVLEQARFRSKLVGAALGLFGGPPRKCTEVERRLRKPDCLALHGEALEDELARNEAIAK